MVTDLDPHQVARALVSLSAELTRREHILAAAGAKDIEDYQLLVDGRQAPPLPRLVIVIDEFAAMSRELPDFVTGLVNIAQRGRSLGIHLILATQRPSGVVSARRSAPTPTCGSRCGSPTRPRAPTSSASRTPRPSASPPRPGLRPARACLARPVPGRAGRRPAARRRPGR